MKHYLGLDVGVKNTGYALTDDSYVIAKAKGKRAIGVISYEQAETAAERRTYRTARRRNARKQFRIDLLQELFNDSIMEVDKNFLRRLNENDLKNEDRKVEGKYSLFNDKGFCDTHYYKKYPTIYHLRKDLMENSPRDVRLLYLAVHHIIKYRGHFLNSGTIKECIEVNDTFERINQLLDDRKQLYVTDDAELSGTNIIPTFDLSNLNKLSELVSGIGETTDALLAEIKDKQDRAINATAPQSITKKPRKIYISKKDKKQKAYELLGATSTSQKNIVNAIMGDKVNITTIFGADEYNKNDVTGFYLSDDILLADDIQLLKDNYIDYELILQLKSAYDWVILSSSLKGESSISQAMINIYENHKGDLKTLKLLISTYLNDKYELVFGYKNTDKKEKENSNEKNEDATKKKQDNFYSSYIGGGKYGGVKLGNNGRVGETCEQRDFYKSIQKLLTQITDPEAQDIIAEISMKIENDMYMPKIVSKNNSAIPFQLNQLELEKILTTAIASGKYNFLNVEKKGWSVARKIVSLLSFRIPHYVGPVKFYKNEKSQSKNAWAIRKEGRVTPWSFDELFDSESIELTNDKFIQRMTNKCTYLKAGTLPKNSILFSKFVALNELNKLKINGEEIDIKIKQKIFDNVYMKEKVTIKRVYRYLIDTLGLKKDIKLSGYDETLKGNMNTYRLYRNIIGDKVDSHSSVVEKLIHLSTIHPESKMIESSIRRDYSTVFTEPEINRLKGLKFSGWGSLSAKLLAGYKNDGIKILYDGELLDVIDIMYDTNLNLQQIISSNICNFNQALLDYKIEKNIVENPHITYDDIDEMYCSPSVKRCVWQSFILVKDLIKQTKIIPDTIFIESARDNNDFKKGKRTLTRRETLTNLYAEARKLSKNLTSEIMEMNHLLSTKIDQELNSERLFLYFLQLGRCMYTDTPISLDELFNENSYDVDHIIPKALIKDDSLDNKVLVCQNKNKDKSREYPLSSDFKQIALWESLYKSKLLSREKYAKLLRTKPITAEEQENFINRQLVETHQTVLLLKDLLVRYFTGMKEKQGGKDVTVLLTKAGNTSTFRKNFALTKSRDVNDFHHCEDAYLAIVVGDILHKKFNNAYRHKFSSTIDKSYNFENALKNKVNDNNCTILNTILKELSISEFLTSKQLTKGKGELYGATLYAASGNTKNSLLPRCQSRTIDGLETNPKSDTSKYGGYKSSGSAYFLIIDSVSKKKAKRTIEPISIYDNALLKAGKITIEDIFKQKGLTDAKLAVIPNLKSSMLRIGSLLDFGTYKLRLTGYSETRLIFHNANQLIVSSVQNDYIKEISTLVQKANKMALLIKEDKESALEKYVNILVTENCKRQALPHQTSKIVIATSEQNVVIYDFFIQKLSHHPYSGIPTYKELLHILLVAKEDFISKQIYSQMALLLNILHAFQCNALPVDISKLSYLAIDKNGNDIKKIGGASQCSIKKNNDITSTKISFISQSKTGLKQKKIYLGL